MTNSRPQSPEEWADLLKANWTKRGQSTSRDFYVASHPGWQSSEVWERHAQADISLLAHELDADWLSRADVLEIGCGVGRLARGFLDRAATYTGFDIASSMIEEARQRLGDRADRARFFESDGLGIPSAVHDRAYHLIVAHAVFIHCPRNVIERLAADAVSLLRPGGHFRFQLLADASDPTGIQAPPEVQEVVHEEILEMQESATPTDMELIDDHYYMGHAFQYAEAKDLFGGLGADLELFRFDLGHIYGDVKRPDGDESQA